MYQVVLYTLSIMRFYNAVLLVALVALLAGNPWRVQGQIVGAECATRGPDVCRECCAEKFQLGTIQEDITCTTPECSPLESALGAPAPEPAAAPTKPVPSPSPVPEKPAVVPAPTVEADAPIAEAIAPIVEAVAPIVEAVETAAEAAGRQADTLIDNLEARDAGAMASMSMVLASVAAILLL